jgi:tRNA-2-methylthio-N6-dimethylallyladenosine synthase
MNVYDSERMNSVLFKDGFRYEPVLEKADVILVNTCSIRAKSEQKVLSLLGQLKPLKERDPKKVIGVTGCVGQRMGRTLLQRVPHLDLVMGPDGIDRVADLVRSVVERGKRIVDAQFDEGGRSYSQPAIVIRSKPSEFLTVMKGCDHFCTYCIVPFVRGREKSRSIEEIIEDTQKLVDRGTKEVVYLGQNINTFGKGTDESLSGLIQKANGISGLERIRYVTSHPRDLGEELMIQFANVEKLCPALHLPFQSGSDRVLKRMSRLYTRDQYLMKIERLRHFRPDIALSTDVIVGFPGETEEDFELTLDLLRRVRFSGVFLFKYSPRPGTRAFSYAEEVEEKVKEERLKRAQDLAFTMIASENNDYIGKITPCLIEGKDKTGRHYSGHNPHAKLVHILNAGEAILGKIVDVEITEAKGSNLRGFYVGAPKRARGTVAEVEAAVSASL